jgi:hypothetical protein
MGDLDFLFSYFFGYTYEGSFLKEGYAETFSLVKKCAGATISEA